MMYSAKDILESLKTRSAGSRWGIGVAAWYLKGLPHELWQKESDDPTTRLTYCDEAMADVEYITKSIKDGPDITPGAVLEYDCVLTSRRRDRDGDILEPKGMDIDERMPLLWQHIQTSPIGKHVKVLEQSDSVVRCKFAIADTELGRDAATLVRFGALRKSHGFKPIEFRPAEVAKAADGRETVRGWHVLKGAVMEGSLVSIPSNLDGNIYAVYEKEFDGLCTAFSRGQLQNEHVKAWAKSLYDRRPTIVAGFGTNSDRLQDRYFFNELAERWQDRVTKKFVSAAEVGVQTATAAPAEDKMGKPGETKGESKVGVMADTGGGAAMDNRRCTACGGRLDQTDTCQQCGQIQPKEPSDEQKAFGIKRLAGTGFIPGSWEATEMVLQSQVKSYLTEKGASNLDGAAIFVHSTFADKCVVCVFSGPDGENKTYEMKWSAAESGPKFFGQPVAIDNPAAVDRFYADLAAKCSGKANSAASSAASVDDDDEDEDEQAKKKDESAAKSAGDVDLEAQARALIAKSFQALGDEGQRAIKALEMVAKAADVLKQQRDAEEMQQLLGDL